MGKEIDVKTCVVFGDELPDDAVHVATTVSALPYDWNQLVEWDMFQGKDDTIYARPGCIKCKCCGHILKQGHEVTRRYFINEDEHGAVLEVVWRINLHDN